MAYVQMAFEEFLQQLSRLKKSVTLWFVGKPGQWLLCTACPACLKTALVEGFIIHECSMTVLMLSNIPHVATGAQGW